VPLGERRPMLEMPAGGAIDTALSMHGGGLESYDFHAFEVLESFIESRRGGESGIAGVQLIAGERFVEYAQSSAWPAELVNIALAAENQAAMERQTRPIATTSRPHPDVGDHAILIEHVGGLRTILHKHGKSSDRWNFVARLKNDQAPFHTAIINGPWGNFNLFSALSHAIAHFFKTSKSPYPVERTLLASGLLDAAMRSHAAGGKVIETPELHFSYETSDWSRFRETGSSWKVITAGTPQPTTFEPRR